MLVDGNPVRPIERIGTEHRVRIIDQTALPHRFTWVTLETLDAAAHAIRAMLVRGAPLIGATAAYGMAIALTEDPSDGGLARASAVLGATRPTAVNLQWAIASIRGTVEGLAEADRAAAAWQRADAIAEEDAALNRSIGDHGLAIVRDHAARKPAGQPVRILTHCNAGWLATVDWGTATACMYRAQEEGIPIHVYVDETRPRNQGAGLTAWELNKAGIPHTVIVDNAGGHLMQHGMVDFCIVGTDRTTSNGDVANKIGTYLKALAASDNGVPFYVALPSPTIDWQITDGIKQIPIEERAPTEVTHIQGKLPDGTIAQVQLTPDGSPAVNYGFDVTPARLITGLVTERGVCSASAEGLLSLFPERRLSAAGD